MSVMEILQWLEETRIGVLVQEDPWLFPILVSIHILGLTLSVGTLVWFDLRLLGFGIRNCSVSRLYRRLMPWMLGSFFVMVVSGSMLFIGFATKAYPNIYFRIKVAGLVVAGVNALIYHLKTERHIAEWDEARVLPLRARMAGLVSILSWTTVILAGRMISYTMYDVAG
ncbi:MAG: putative rane protein [Acidobacteria bacterium]|nr:putative rane protein [Acidobacteriota bacterium]